MIQIIMLTKMEQVCSKNRKKHRLWLNIMSKITIKERSLDTIMMQKFSEKKIIWHIMKLTNHPKKKFL